MPSDKVAPLNRAERRRRGMTRSRMRKAGTMAAAGALLSTGLLGGYVGNPRLTRASAAPSDCLAGSGTAGVSDDASLRIALLNADITCILIEQDITVSAPLPTIGVVNWRDGDRNLSGLTIKGDGPSRVINGANHSGIHVAFNTTTLSGPLELHVSSLTMQNFQSASTGGAAIYVKDLSIPGYGNSVLVDFNRVTFRSNVTTSSPGSGGAVAVASGSSYVEMTIEDSLFDTNTSDDSGGAIFLYSQHNLAPVDLSVISSQFLGSDAQRGGAIEVVTRGQFSPIDVRIDEDLDPSVSSSDFIGNSSDHAGGAISLMTAEKSSPISGYIASYFHDNSAGESGGAIYVATVEEGSGIELELNRSTFSNNVAGSSGGALYMLAEVPEDGASVYLETLNTVFEQNRADDSGGAIFGKSVGDFGRTHLNLGNFTSFTDDSAVSGSGGAVYAQSDATSIGPFPYYYTKVDTSNVTFSGNEAPVGSGAAIHAAGGFLGVVTGSLSTFAGGVSGGNGAIYASHNVNLGYSSVVDNVGAGVGGLSAGELAYLTNIYVGGNSSTSTTEPGAIAAPEVVLRFSTVYNNSTAALLSGPSAISASTRLIARGSAVGTDDADQANLIQAGALTTVASASSATAGRELDLNGSPGFLDLAPRSGTSAGEVSRVPNLDSPLVLQAPSANPVPSVAADQVGLVRTGLGTFTIGSRQWRSTVAFNANLGTGSMNVQRSASNSTALTTNAFTRAGFTFAGWNTQADGGGTDYPDGAAFPFASTPLNTTVTLYAQWTAVGAFTVTFDANGGTGSMGPQTASTATALTANAFTRAGFTFAGWNTQVNGLGTPYANGASYPFTANATLYAQWTPVSPDPGLAPSAPREVSAVAGDGSALVSWRVPESEGSFPVTDYEVRASPGGQSCVVKVPALSCTISGLSHGTAYTFEVRALNGAGWGSWSVASDPVTPVGPTPRPTIMITGYRGEGADAGRVFADGVTTRLAGQRLQARVHLQGEVLYYNGSTPAVASDGSFRWQRKTNKTVYVYFQTMSGDFARSNRVIIRLR